MYFQVIQKNDFYQATINKECCDFAEGLPVLISQKS